MSAATLTGNAPKVPFERIEALKAKVTYITFNPVGTTSTFVHAYLNGNFYLATGHSACVSPANFDAQIGYTLAKREADDKVNRALWDLEGYALYNRLNDVITVTSSDAEGSYERP